MPTTPTLDELLRETLWIQYDLHQHLTDTLDKMQRHYQQRLDEHNAKACRRIRFAMQDHNALRQNVRNTIERLEAARMKLATTKLRAAASLRSSSLDRN